MAFWRGYPLAQYQWYYFDTRETMFTSWQGNAIDTYRPSNNNKVYFPLRPDDERNLCSLMSRVMNATKDENEEEDKKVVVLSDDDEENKTVMTKPPGYEKAVQTAKQRNRWWEVEVIGHGMKPRDSWTIRYDFKTRSAAEKVHKMLKREGLAILADDAGGEVWLNVCGEPEFHDSLGVEGMWWKMVEDLKGQSMDEWLEDHKDLKNAKDYVPDFAKMEEMEELKD